MQKPAEMPLNMYKPKNPSTARVVSSELLTEPGEEEVRHIVFDLTNSNYQYIEGQSLGILPPGVNEKGKPHKLRLYSIASARKGEAADGRLLAALCVKRVAYEHPETGEKVYGVCSNYLCDLKVGAEVQITGPAGKHFVLPEDMSTDHILLATGTGLAPFRGFLHHLYNERSDYQGRCILFFGAKFFKEVLYLNDRSMDLEQFKSQSSYELVTACSREYPERGKVYVQHRMAEQQDALREILARGNFSFYICGLKGMEGGIEEAMTGILSDMGENWETVRTELKEAGRWNVEVY